MIKAEMIRELRKDGYTVLSPDELEAVEDLQHWCTCGCGTYGIEEALAKTSDPRDELARPVLWSNPPSAKDFMKAPGKR